MISRFYFIFYSLEQSASKKQQAARLRLAMAVGAALTGFGPPPRIQQQHVSERMPPFSCFFSCFFFLLLLHSLFHSFDLGCPADADADAHDYTCED